MRLRVVFEPCFERLSPPAGECSPEFMRWVRDVVATDVTIMLAEWVPDEYPFPAAPSPEGSPLPVPDGSPLST